MSIACNVVKTLSVRLDTGPRLAIVRMEVTGLQASASNTIPHGLPHTPSCVLLQSVGNNALGVVISLDDSQGDASANLGGGHTGWNSTNIYVVIGNITELVVYAIYGVY